MDRYHSDKMHKCDICDKQYKAKEDLSGHKKKKHEKQKDQIGFIKNGRSNSPLMPSKSNKED